jgi:hypothetical protein
MRFRLAAVLAVISFCSLVVEACSDESEGMPCDPNNGNSDCASGLQCTRAPNSLFTGDRCCPMSGTPTTAECSSAVGGPVYDAAVPPAMDASSEASPEASDDGPGEGASDGAADAAEGGASGDAAEGDAPADGPDGGTPADGPEGDAPGDAADGAPSDAAEGGAPSDAADATPG